MLHISYGSYCFRPRNVSNYLHFLNCEKFGIVTNLPVNTMISPYHPLHGVSQGQETILAPSGDKQTHNWDTECSNHHLSQSTQRSKGLKRSKMKGRAIYTKLPRNARLPHLLSLVSHGHSTFLASSAEKQTRNWDRESLMSKELSHSKMKWWAIYTNLPLNAIVRLLHPKTRDNQAQPTFLAPSADM